MPAVPSPVLHHNSCLLDFQQKTLRVFLREKRVCGSTNSQSESCKTSQFPSGTERSTSGTHTDNPKGIPTLPPRARKSALQKLDEASVLPFLPPPLPTLTSFLSSFLIQRFHFHFFTFHALPQPTAEEVFITLFQTCPSHDSFFLKTGIINTHRAQVQTLQQPRLIDIAEANRPPVVARLPRGVGTSFTPGFFCSKYFCVRRKTVKMW